MPLPSPSVTPASLAQDVQHVARLNIVPTLLDAACRVTGMRFAAIARVTDARWIACAVDDRLDFGLQPGAELDLRSTLCDEVRQSSQPILIDDAPRSALYHNHRTPKQYNFRSYISVPIVTRQGEFFGTLCALDPDPKAIIDTPVRATFEIFAQLIAEHLDKEQQLIQHQSDLAEAEKTAEIRDRFIGILGHDLRSPLSAISIGMTCLDTSIDTFDAESQSTLQLIRQSARRMHHLIDDLTDFARGHLGSGLPLLIRLQVNLAQQVNVVVGELQPAHPNRQIKTEILGDPHADCDPHRIIQLLSNLLANALVHGEPDGEIVIRIAREPDIDGAPLRISVTNPGRFPPNLHDNLFEPFTRDHRQSAPAAHRHGLGLGLFICQQIAQAHRGHLTAQSADGQTRFSFLLPTHAPPT